MKKQVAELPNIVKQDEAYQNAMQHSDAQNARAESDRATTKAILDTMSSGIELYKAVQGNDSFRKWIMDMVFNATYTKPYTYTADIDTGARYVAEEQGIYK